MILASCDQGGEPREITRTREPSASEKKIPLDISAAERYGFRDATPRNPFRWEMPEGWVAAESTSMRVANFRFGDSGEGEVYLSAMPGAAGGMAANINRWRTQMGREPLSEAEIEDLPTVPLLDQPAPFVAIDGAYSAVGSSEPLQDYRMLGAILSYAEFTLFVKMAGPAELVRQQEKNFEAFCRSVRIVSQEDAISG